MAVAAIAAPQAIEGATKAFTVVEGSSLVQDQRPLLRKTLFGGVLGIAGYIGVSFVTGGGITGALTSTVKAGQSLLIDSTAGVVANLFGYKGSLGDKATGRDQNNETFVQKYGAAVAGIAMFGVGFYFG